MTTHRPVARNWDCAGCGAAWPCRTRRLELRAEFDGTRVSLSIYMSRFFIAAAQDLPYIASGQLHHRFLGWIRHPEPDLPRLHVARPVP
jgi:hypothetical protein